MSRFKFVGGPWDGQFHDVDGRPYLYVAYPSLIEKQVAKIVDEPIVLEPIKTCRYSLREFTMVNGQNKVSFYADAQWSDFHAFTLLIHHYKGQP